MNVAETQEDAAFRADVRDFLARELSDDLRRAAASTIGTFCPLDAMTEWHRKLHAQGWAAPDWPEAHGGPGWSDAQRYIFASECALAGAPSAFSFGLKMSGPVIMRYGTAAQQAFYLPRILSAEHRWCQGYSEPGSGSDLASLQTRAQRDGEHYVVDGTKIWTTLAHQATHIFCLVRTSADARPQGGITFLLIDMATPGITVRPIVNIAGEHEFNQVFFDQVRVPIADRLGAEGQGWAIAKHLLEFERGSAYAAGLHARLAHIREAGAQQEAPAAWWRRLAAAAIDVRAVEMQERRIVSALAVGQSPGPSASLIKLLGSELQQRLGELALEVRGAAAFCPDDGARVDVGRYLYDRSLTIFGGTSEIQRNLLARAALEL